MSKKKSPNSGRCSTERAAISRAPKGRPKGLALQKFMACKRGGKSKVKHKFKLKGKK
jgi:hypothetical protein